MPPAEQQILTPAGLRDWPLPVPDGDKDSRGRVLVIGGARSAPGAAMLAGQAALRVGAGVLTLAVGQSVAGPVAAAVPEAGVLWLPDAIQFELDGRPYGTVVRADLAAGQRWVFDKPFFLLLNLAVGASRRVRPTPPRASPRLCSSTGSA